LAIGRTDDALVAATSAVALSRKHKEGGYQAWALRLLGEIKARENTWGLKEADAAFTQSLELASSLGMRPLVAHCHSGLASVERQIGKQTKAQEHHRTASRMFEEMGMIFWQERVETGWKT
jgi:uncharacterized protein HemY